MTSLDIHGKLVSEAQIEVDLFIKEMYNRRESQILIIHGHGSYRLKECVSEICTKSKLVKNFNDAPPQIGGSGATMINLKTKR